MIKFQFSAEWAFKCDALYLRRRFPVLLDFSEIFVTDHLVFG